MAPMSTYVSRLGAAARRTPLLLPALLLGTALPAVGQVREVPPVAPRQEVVRRELPPAAVGDLVITSVTVKDNAPSPGTVALVTIQNKGSAPVTFPAGSALVRGDAAAAGGVAFPAMTAPGDYTIDAGASKQLTVSIGDVCAAGKPGTVIFKVDPDGKVRETNEANNSFSLSNVAPYAAGDLVAISVGLKSTAPSYGDMKASGVPAAYPAILEVMVKSAGSGPALLCAGEVIFKETASPVSGKYGLRTYKFGGPTKLQNPGTATIWGLANGMAAGDLPPGTYNWAVQVNPDGRTPETSKTNNAATAQIIVD